MTVLETFFKFGVQFPVHPYFRRILNHYNLTVFQVTPNGWAQMIRLFVLYVERKMDPPILEEMPTSTRPRPVLEVASLS